MPERTNLKLPGLAVRTSPSVVNGLIFLLGNVDDDDDLITQGTGLCHFLRPYLK